MTENTPANSKPIWALKKSTTVIVIAIGAILLALAIFISTEAGTTADTVKKLTGMFGVIVIFFGLWARPQKQEQKISA